MRLAVRYPAIAITLLLYWWTVPLAFSGSEEQPPAVQNPALIDLPMVIQSVTSEYPPLLAALIERDVASARLQSASGTFDLDMVARVLANPSGFYEHTTIEAGVEQYIGIWGATLFGGYRWTDGILPDYYRNRTAAGGEPSVGLKIPLLQDGAIDKRRAAVLKAQLDRELADPYIQRQMIDLGRSATVAYFAWVAAAQQLQIAESVLLVTSNRQSAIETQVSRGLSAPIVLKENQQLLLSREMAVLQGRRSLEAAALTLSLFLRDGEGRPVVASTNQMQVSTIALPQIGPEPDGTAISLALERRPEIRELDLKGRKLDVDLRLARNSLLPILDASIRASEGLGDPVYKDTGEFELKAGLEFRMPLQRREAQGRSLAVQAELRQLENQLRYAMDRIATEMLNAHSALRAAKERTLLATTNVNLARELQQVERDRFQLGASDLITVQIREQSAIQAEQELVKSQFEVFKAQADLLAAFGFDFRSITALPDFLHTP
jgi:outer membrane protein TolC